MKESRVTINDIAKALDITPSTVSRALNNNPRISEATKKAVNEMAEKLKYQPNFLASSLRKGRGNILGVIIPRINRNFFANVIGSIEQVANEQQFNVIICQTHESFTNEVAAVEALINLRVDGILFSLSAETSSYTHIEKIKQLGIPFVGFDRVIEQMTSAKVFIDDSSASYGITSNLIKKGHKKIAHFGGPSHINVYKKRQMGYRKAFNDYNIEIDEALIFEDALTLDKGKSIAEQLVENNNLPQAVVAASDFSGLGCILKLQSKGLKIPEDVAVAGFANEPFTGIMFPSMTSVEQFPDKIGRTAASMLLEQIADRKKMDENKEIIIQPKIIFRESTG